MQEKTGHKLLFFGVFGKKDQQVTTPQNSADYSSRRFLRETVIKISCTCVELNQFLKNNSPNRFNRQ